MIFNINDKDYGDVALSLDDTLRFLLPILRFFLRYNKGPLVGSTIRFCAELPYIRLSCIYGIF